tara:strand:- start:38 stop:634 length:597 start_codon:yes stop_codon:yes gene_type:complete
MKLETNFFGYLLIAFVILISLKIYSESDVYNLKCIISHVDGNTYCVRERAKIQLAADLLARTTEKMKKITRHLEKKYPKRKNVQRLAKNFNPKKVKETLPTSKYTAYAENKGEKIAFCTTTEKDNSKLIDENTLTFVALHELTHVMTISVGHKKEFWDNFKFVLKEAKNIGIYNPIDYKNKPVKYCGMQINDNPYYDM